MKNRFLILFVLVIISSCSSAKKIVSSEQLESLKNAVENNLFEMNANSANPVAFANVRGIENLLPLGSNAANISLVNIPNYFRVQKDSIQLDLPYYGELQMPRAYGADNGLSFEGAPKKVVKEFNAKKNSYSIIYTLKAENESLKATLTLFANNSATLHLNSSIRTTIVYYGSWKALRP